MLRSPTLHRRCMPSRLVFLDALVVKIRSITIIPNQKEKLKNLWQYRDAYLIH